MFVKHFDVKDWEMDVELYPGNSSEPAGGCVLRNVRHGGYNLLRDLRVCRLWLATSPPHREDPSSTKGVKN